ncbi:hypothetical protein CYMTET_35781 [Cymbomonas tetramitiformis]|uniref:SPX domain-containing protein n=1 Tax=Cymbomonas tetramitiformis TaxID=36881 RepID=A0AAE0F8I1_9CHLO|nr:hypothetical protein CYMTET_35781 [Cymbomonas tetramitiformis]
MKFGRRMLSECPEQMAEGAIPYKTLKKLIKHLHSSSEASGEKAQFLFEDRLTAELAKSSVFSEGVSKRLTAEVAKIEVEGRVAASVAYALAKQVDDLHRMCVLNYIGIFKLVKKWNKLANYAGRPLSSTPILIRAPVFRSKALHRLFLMGRRLTERLPPVSPTPRVEHARVRGLRTPVSKSLFESSLGVNLEGGPAESFPPRAPAWNVPPSQLVSCNGCHVRQRRFVVLTCTHIWCWACICSMLEHRYSRNAAEVMLARRRKNVGVNNSIRRRSVSMNDLAAPGSLTCICPTCRAQQDLGVGHLEVNPWIGDDAYMWILSSKDGKGRAIQLSVVPGIQNLVNVKLGSEGGNPITQQSRSFSSSVLPLSFPSSNEAASEQEADGTDSSADSDPFDFEESTEDFPSTLTVKGKGSKPMAIPKASSDVSISDQGDVASSVETSPSSSEEGLQQTVMAEWCQQPYHWHPMSP